MTLLALWRKLLPNPETPGQAPFSFMISVLGSFTCITQHNEPTALRPIRRTKQLWLSVLLKDTSAATGQAGIRTHILITPELESNALDRSATTHHEPIKPNHQNLITPSALNTIRLFVLHKIELDCRNEFKHWNNFWSQCLELQ